MEAGGWCEYAVVAHEVAARRGDERGQACDEVEWLEYDGGRAVSPFVAQVDGDAVAGQQAQSLAGDGGARNVSAEPLEPAGVGGPNRDVGVQREPSGLGDERPVACIAGRVEGVALALSRLAGVRAEQLDLVGGGRGAGAKGHLVFERADVGILEQPAALEHGRDTLGDPGRERYDLGVGRDGRGQEGRAAVRALDIGAVRHQ